MDKNAKIFVAGHRGLVGSAIVRILQENGYNNLVLRTHKEVDLTDFNAVNNLFKNEGIEYVFLAGKSWRDTRQQQLQGDFIYQITEYKTMLSTMHTSIK